MRTHGGEEPTYVWQVIEYLQQFPGSHAVSAYEGEGTGLNVIDERGEHVGWIDAESIDHGTTEVWAEHEERRQREREARAAT